MDYSLKPFITTKKPFLQGVTLVCLAVTLGCSGQSDNAASSSNSKLPKLTFHRPPTGSDAINRIKELVHSVRADQALPEDRKFQVREVIHGSGASAHSHYYLVKDNSAGDHSESHDDHDDHDDHEHMESSEKRHEVSVDVFTELYDIARWLPKIAAKGDLAEEQWTAVKSVSDEMLSTVGDLAGDQSTDKKRELVRENSENFDRWCSQLETAFEVTDS